ncbi:PIN-like domain-containing protein [Amycolatopsis sp. lyj-84]|uniref:PIN-like domain-containing protein n=1 Tax=Amycolatopsis sp. lyj-84 TaxID=2789284 RepID=UPI00397B1CD6
MADSEDVVHESASLTDMFEGYLTPTDGDYQSVLTSGLVVPDANVLLNLYRYASVTREDLITVLGKLGERLWVPHQTAFEFWKNRENALDDLKKVTGETSASLEELSSQVSTVISTWANRISLDKGKRQEIVETIRNGFKAAFDAIHAHGDFEGRNGHWDTNQDQILVSLKDLFKGKVGTQLKPDEEKEARSEARRRIAEKVPPGFKDAGKDDPCGDYLYWLQTLQEARRRQVDVLIVTDDSRSDDWYRRPGGQTRGPRLELIREMSEFAKVRLFMMRTQSLLHHATQALEVNVRPSSVKEAAQVDERPKIYAENIFIDQDGREIDRSTLDRAILDTINRRRADELDSGIHRAESRRNKAQYEEHLISLGFSVRSGVGIGVEWDSAAERGNQTFHVYYLNRRYALDETLMHPRLARLIGDEERLRASHPNEVIVFPVRLAPTVYRLIEMYDFGAVWWGEDSWEGNIQAMRAGLIF